MDEETKWLLFVQDYTVWVVGYGILTFGIIGIFGNCLNIGIYCKKQFRTSINLLILALSVFDLILSLCYVLLFAILAIYLYRYPNLLYNSLAYNFLLCFNNGVQYSLTLSQFCTIYLTIGISLERFIAVCYPLRARLICTYKNTVFLLLGIIGAGMIINIPTYFAQSVVPINITIPENQTNPIVEALFGEVLGYKWALAFSEFGHSAFYEFYQKWILTSIGLTIGPFVTLAILNTMIFIAIQKSTMTRNQMASASDSTTQANRSSASITKMLLCIVLIFGICYFLPFCKEIYTLFAQIGRILKEDRERNKFIAIVDPLISLLGCINSSINFVVYFCMSTPYRRVVLSMLPCIKSNKPGNSRLGQSMSLSTSTRITNA